MAKHEVKPHANKLDSKAKWPFLGTYIPKNTLTLDGILPDLAKEAGGTETQAKAILEGAFDILEQLETEGLVRYNLPGGFAVGPVVRGSFPASNSPWNPDVNKLELALAIDGTIRNELADQTAVIVTDETMTKAIVHRLVDIAEPAPDNLIHGTHRFRVQGKKMILLPDDPPYLKNSYGTRFELVIDDPGDGQNFEAHSAELLEGGDYRLCVPTKAGEDDGVDQCPSKPVKYMKVVDSPTVDDIASEGHEGEIVSGTAFAAKGSGLDAFDTEGGDTVKVKWTQGGEDKEALIDPADIAADKLSFEFPDALVGVPMDTELTFEITFGEVHKTKGSKLVES